MENSFNCNAPISMVTRPGFETERTLSNTRDAAHFLVFEWPWARGLTHDHALRACGLVLAGIIDPEMARCWLIKAAKESDATFVLV